MILHRFQIGLLATAAAGLVVLAGARGARGFDSAGSEFGLKTHNIPSPPPNFPHGSNFMLPDQASQASDPFCIANGCPPVAPWASGLKYYSKTIHYSLGGLAGDGTDDGAVLGVYFCPRDAVTNQVHLSQCAAHPAQATGTEPEHIAWLQVRRTWDQRAAEGTAIGGTGHAPEHMYILQEAAKAAGFDEIRLLKQRFWVRYPVDDHYLVTPMEPDPPTRPLFGGLHEFVVGQSWLPVGFRDMSRRSPGREWSLAVRGVSLPELAQLPDVSNSLWDWAGGNEACPVNGISESDYGAFGDRAYDLNACHDFTRVMGAINSSHFLPSARSFYDHYHSLAKRRIDECKRLVSLLPFYNENYEVPISQGHWVRYASPDNSEAHECEREAMAYEMMAQHYLQDAWSTGHMWKRWGYPDLNLFPSRLGESPYYFLVGDRVVRFPNDTNSVPTANVAPRRFIIAAITAAFAGTIHGAKGLVSDLWRKGTLNLNNDPPAFTDDPLCGPSYIFPPDGSENLVEWVDSAEGSRKHPGVGDMFWDPYDPAPRLKEPGSPADAGADGGNLNSSDSYIEQRKRLLGCSGASLREVYDSGPRAHGELAPYQRAFDPSGPECWEHWVTNASMLGAIGPMRLTRDWSAPPYLQPWQTVGYWQSAMTQNAFSLANTIMLSNRIDVARFSGTTLTDLLDETNFKQLLARRSNLDVLGLESVFAANAIKNPAGIESAQLVAWDQSGAPVRFLTIPPNEPTSPGVLPAPFSDRAAPRELEPQTDSVALQHPTDHYVARMFWRAHLDELCTDTSLVLDLRDRCVGASALGGDPDACTACVDVAEAFIPPCGIFTDGQNLGKSKCEVLTGHQAPVPEWYDWEARVASSNAFACGLPSYFMAVTFCTGTEPDPSRSTLRKEIAPYSDGPLQCDNAPSRRSVYRRGVLHLEQPSSLPVTSMPGPVISAYDVEEYFDAVDVGGFCIPRTASDRDAATATYLGKLPLWNDYAQGNVARGLSFDPTPPEIFFCGVTQRIDWFNQGCGKILDLVDFPGPLEQGEYDSSTGFQWLETSLVDNPAEKRCSVREKRTLRGTCPVGQCNTGGVCVGRSPGTPPGVVFSDKLW